MQIEIKSLGLKEIELILGGMKEKAPSVLYNVANRVASNVRKNLSKEVLKKYGIKSADVKKTVSMKRASKADPSCYVTTVGGTIQLYKFKTKPKDVVSTKGIKVSKRKKVKVKVLKSSSLKESKHSFIQRMANGHVGVFRRKLASSGIKNTISNKSRYSEIKELHGPSVPQMVSNEEVINNIYKDAEVTYNKRINHEINRILSR